MSAKKLIGFFIFIILIAITALIGYQIKLKNSLRYIPQQQNETNTVQQSANGVIRNKPDGKQTEYQDGFNFVVPKDPADDKLSFNIYPDKFDLGIFKFDYDYMAKANFERGDKYLTTPYKLNNPYKIVYHYEDVFKDISGIKEAYILVHQLDWKNDEYKRLDTTVDEANKNIYAFYDTTAVAIVVINFKPDCNEKDEHYFVAEETSIKGVCLLTAANVYDETQYSLEYPSEWVPNLSGGAYGDAVAFYHPGFTNQLNVKLAMSDLPLNEIYKGTQPEETGNEGGEGGMPGYRIAAVPGNITSTADLDINGISAFRVISETDSETNVHYFIKKDKYYFDISASLPTSEYASGQDKTFRKIENVVKTIKYPAAVNKNLSDI